jgi:hypothetical protein
VKHDYCKDFPPSRPHRSSSSPRFFLPTIFAAGCISCDYSRVRVSPAPYLSSTIGADSPTTDTISSGRKIHFWLASLQVLRPESILKIIYMGFVIYTCYRAGGIATRQRKVERTAFHVNCTFANISPSSRAHRWLFADLRRSAKNLLMTIGPNDGKVRMKFVRNRLPPITQRLICILLPVKILRTRLWTLKLTCLPRNISFCTGIAGTEPFILDKSLGNRKGRVPRA